MAWPTSDVDTTDLDADTDSPLAARSDLFDLAQKFNALRNHVTTYIQGFLASTDSAAARSTLGLGDAAVQNTTAFWSTGDVKVTFKTSPDTGWVMMNDGTIGNAVSGATTRANADTLPLYTLIWTNTAQADCPVSGGSRGASALADFNANKTIALPKALGRELAIAGAGSGLTSRALASVLGVETIGTTHLPPSGLSIPSLSVSASGSCSGTTMSATVSDNNGGNTGTTYIAATPTTNGDLSSFGLTGWSFSGSSSVTGSTGGGTTGNMGAGNQFLNPRFHANVMIKL